MHQVVDLKGGTEKKEQPTQDLESWKVSLRFRAVHKQQIPVVWLIT